MIKEIEMQGCITVPEAVSMERPLTPEVLAHWVETLSRPLFGQQFSCTLAQVPSRQEAMKQFEKEMRLMR